MVAIFTFIRHGESEDNLKSVWAGWKDAPLSSLGKRQAHALGQSFSNIPLTHIYSSPLLRAHSTALALHSQQPDPKPPLTPTPLLREQHFGSAEGQPWTLYPPPDTTLEELFRRGVYPVLFGRDEKFPNGETLEDLAKRAEEAVRVCVLPYVAAGEEQEGNQVHVALTSHGLCISELIPALLKLDPHALRAQSYTGLVNTAWTRLEVRVRAGHSGPIDPHHPPPLEVRITHINNKDHLTSQKLKPAKAVDQDVNIQSAEGQIDETKAEAQAFFGGGGAKAAEVTHEQVVDGEKQK